jgi:uncharacterized repeat protein (TIGR03803 family)
VNSKVNQSGAVWFGASRLLATGALLLLALLSAATLPVSAQTYSVVFSFPGGTDGAFPFGSVTRSHTGVVYGNTYNTDGANGGTGFGVAYEVSADGSEKVPYTFKGPPSDGGNSKGGMIHYHGLYSTTTSGGSGTNCTGGCGTVWTHSFSEGGKWDKILHNFTGGSDDGAAPVGDLARDVLYNLYGVTTYGGNTACSSQGCGVLYKVTLAGVETILHTFSGPDGEFPRSGLTTCKECSNTNDHVYGTTAAGGTANAGTVFTFELNGDFFTTLYQFKGGADGSDPEGSVVADQAGNLYGTTLNGGGSTNCPGGCGTVFKITPQGQETVLYAFTGGADGAHPRGTIAVDSSGNVYGAATDGGVSTPGHGVIFEVTSGGAETVIHAFAGGTDGANPFSGVVMDDFGNLYGTTVYGGDMSCGTQGCGIVYTAHP